jgi:hypothetical protein
MPNKVSSVLYGHFALGSLPFGLLAVGPGGLWSGTGCSSPILIFDCIELG